MSQLLDRLSKDFQNEDARYAYADSLVNTFVSAQIKALREKENLSQEKLAELIGTKQSGISRLEKADYSAWKVETLRKLSKAFGVRLDISFKDFGSLLPDISGFTKERLTPKKFTDDPVFKEPESEPQHKDALVLSTPAPLLPPPMPGEQPIGKLQMLAGMSASLDPAILQQIRDAQAESVRRVRFYTESGQIGLAGVTALTLQQLAGKPQMGEAKETEFGAQGDSSSGDPSADRYHGFRLVPKAPGDMPPHEQQWPDVSSDATLQSGRPLADKPINIRGKLHQPRRRGSRIQKRA